MNPAFSVIFFTVLSGAGYGLLAWTGIFILSAYLEGRVPHQGVGPLLWAVLLLIGLAMSIVGLVSSMFHLGKPTRAWRAFSQWRSSWLSREGVLAILTTVPIVLVLGMAAVVYFERSYAVLAGLMLPTLACAIVTLSLGTVFCTAMIYASLKTVPAWKQRLVAPAYLVFAVYTGGLIVTALFADHITVLPLPAALLGVMATMSIVAMVIKRSYWRAIDRIKLPSRESATALEGFGAVTTFERPHTEANYLTREMGFVLARKHSRKLRAIAVALFAGIPLLALTLAWLLPVSAGFALWIAALSALLGTFIERWLFFAEAKHLVTLYY